MKTERIALGLFATAVILQGMSLIMQNRTPSRPVDSRERRPPVAEAANGTTVALKGLPIQGSADAKVVVIEFSDFECPYCARHANEVQSQIQERFVKTGKIRYAYANNPLPSHHNARMLATAAVCAHAQGKFLEMHDALFKEKPTTRVEVQAVATNLSLDNQKFSQCFTADNTPPQIEEDIKQAKRLKMGGTPSFAIGTALPGGQVVMVQWIIMGAQNANVFETAIEKVIRS